MGQLDHVKLEDLRAVVDFCEGWSIIPPSDPILAKLPKRFVEHLVVRYKSDRRNPKATIFGPDGQVQDVMLGIHDLNLLYAICNDLGVGTTMNLSGRGFQTRELQKRLARKFEEMENVQRSSSGG